MSRYGKCQNFSGCLLAYRGEETEVDSDQPFICAECGKPLTEVGSPSTMWLRYGYAALGAVVLGGLVIFAVPSIRHKVFKPKKEDAGEVRQTGGSTADPGNVEPPPSQPPVVDNSPPPAEPPPTITAPPVVEMRPEKSKSVKSE